MTRRGPSRESVRAALELTQMYHESDLSLTTRTMYWGSPTLTPDGEEGGLDARFAEGALKNLHVLESLSDAPVTVVLNCVGGDVYHGLAVYDAVRCSPCEVKMVVRGQALSMGSVVLQAADRRVMGPSATQLLHYGTSELAGHSKTVWRNALEGERVNAWMERVYLGRIREKHPEFTLKKLRELLDHDTYLDAVESLALGLADEVG